MGRTEFDTWFSIMVIVHCCHFFFELRCVLGVFELHEQKQPEIVIVEKLEVLEVRCDRVPEVRFKAVRQFHFGHGTFSASVAERGFA